MMTSLLALVPALALWFAPAAPATAAGGPEAPPKLDGIKVARTGRAFGYGDSVAFPARKTKGVVFAPSILEGKSREDGYLDTARSADGRRLWVKQGTDDGDVSIVLFEAQGGQLPAGAVLQMVDGFTTPDPGGQPGGLGSAAFKRGEEIRKQHFEAWLALPKDRAVIRLEDRSRYPLVATTGRYDESQAAKAQWVVFVSRCEENKGGPCVLYGPPAQACSRSSKQKESDGLLVYPAKCK
jgi:hypothetical protein